MPAFRFPCLHEIGPRRTYLQTFFAYDEVDAAKTLLMQSTTIGLLKLNDSMTRLHAPTKVGTVGIGSLLLASMIHSFVVGEGSLHELLIIAFLFVTAPISANFIAKVNLEKIVFVEKRCQFACAGTGKYDPKWDHAKVL